MQVSFNVVLIGGKSYISFDVIRLSRSQIQNSAKGKLTMGQSQRSMLLFSMSDPRHFSQ